MPTLTIDLDELTYRRMEARARARSVDLGQVAAEAVRASADADAESGVSPDMLAIMDDVIRTYRPVFDRLAQ